MYLNGNEILQYITDPLNKGLKQPNSYDLSVKKIKMMGQGKGIILKTKTYIPDYKEIEPDKYLINEELIFGWNLSRGTYSLTFNQGCKLTADVHGKIRQRSSLLRACAEIKSGVFDSGFEVAEIGSTLRVRSDIFIQFEARVATIQIMQNNPTELYSGQWQNEKDKK